MGGALFLLLLLLPFSSCKQSFSDTGKEAAQNAGKEDQKKAEKEPVALPVKISQVEEDSIFSFLLVSSDLEAESHVEVFCREKGIVEKILALEGDHVKKGDVLACLEDDELRLSTDNARINLENMIQTEEQARVALEDSREAVTKARLLMEKSQRAFERCKKYEEITSEEEFEEKKFQYEQYSLEHQKAQLQLKKAEIELKMFTSNVAKARNDLKLIEIRLANTEVKAPISGKITDRYIREGEYLRADTKAFKIVNTEVLLAYVDIPQKELALLKAGLEVQVTADALPGESFRGKVRLVSPVVDPLSGTVKVTIDLLEGHARLKPGMFIKTRITLEKRDNALLIPKQAILYEPTGPAFFTLLDGKAKKVNFSPGLAETHRMEILKANDEIQVKAGDPIVVVGQNKIKDGDTVLVVEEEPLPESKTREE